MRDIHDEIYLSSDVELLILRDSIKAVRKAALQFSAGLISAGRLGELLGRRPANCMTSKMHAMPLMNE